jgi:hypothetical protein
MKTKLMLLSLMLISTLSFSQTIIRVKSGEKIQDIIDNVNTPAGSILLLDPGSYEGFKVFKRVSIIGSGFLNGNQSSIITGNISFEANNNSNSDNSLLMGCSMNFCSLNRNNISVIKCRFTNNGTGIFIGGNNCNVKQCLIDLWLEIQNVTNFNISNNLILGWVNCSSLSRNISGKIINNTIGGSLEYCEPLKFPSGYTKAIQVSNNILYTKIECDNRTGNNNYNTSDYQKFNNNVVRKGNYNVIDVSNKVITDMTTLFTLSGSNELQYQLSANSPAKGAGEGGTDCGVFGGTEPYIIGGLPVGPVITDLQMPSTARQNETIQIKLKAKVQN